MASLKKKGIARQFVEDNFNKFEESGDLKVGHVLQIYYSASSSVGKTITILRSKCQSINLPAPDVYQSRKKIQTILARVSKLKKLTDSAEFSKFSSLCASEFKIQSSHAEVIGLSVTEDSVPATPQPSCSNVPATPQPSCSNVPTTPQLSRNIVSPSPKHCVNCKHLRIRLKTAIKLRRQLCKQQSVRISTLKEQLAKKPSVRVFNQNLKRKNIKIVALK